MEKFCNNFASKIALELKLDKDRKEVIAYGTFAILQTVLAIVFVIVFGLIFHVAVEALIVSFTASILRKYSGGAHASSPSKCIVIGTIICVGQAIIIRVAISPFANTSLLLLIGAIIFMMSYYLIYKLAPVDSMSKPIRNKEKRYRMKKGSIYVLNAYLILGLLNVVLYSYFGERGFAVYTLCICGGITWQAFTLTKIGHIVVNKTDTFLNQILIVKRGRR
jgi:accessory gene regulator B